MSRENSRGNREKKKPKQNKPKQDKSEQTAAASPFSKQLGRTPAQPPGRKT
jgi:hypothetical protein